MELIYKYIAKQFGNPTGFWGKISTFAMNRLNKEQYKTIFKNIDIQKTDTILDIGFGNGYLLRRLAKENPQKIYGIDISQDMLKAATRKSHKEIEQEKIQLLSADVQKMPFEDSLIDKAYTVNTVYFWQDIHQGFAEIRRILKSNGIFLNVLYLDEWLDKLPITRYGFSKYTAKQIEKITAESGLKIECIIEIQPKKSICIVARNQKTATNKI